MGASDMPEKRYPGALMLSRCLISVVYLLDYYYCDGEKERYLCVLFTVPVGPILLGACDITPHRPRRFLTISTVELQLEYHTSLP